MCHAGMPGFNPTRDRGTTGAKGAACSERDYGPSCRENASGLMLACPRDTWGHFLYAHNVIVYDIAMLAQKSQQNTILRE